MCSKPTKLQISINFIKIIFSHRGQSCPENTWERTNQSSGGWCKRAPMTSQRRYWRDVAIHSGVMTLCFEQLNDVKIGLFIEIKGVGEKLINHYTPEGTRESHPRVHDLRHPRLGKPRRGLQIMDTRMGFPCPFRSVVIDSIILMHRFCTETRPSFVTVYDDDTLNHATNGIKRTLLNIGSKMLY